jgi:tRNA dimethylallyltransferase
MGPTASGKTAIAMDLAKRINGEIISVDSALIYQGMDIGTAKPSPQELAEIPHHLIDICDPKTPYSVADFCSDAKHAIDDILARGKTPLLVGGTMMYFYALKHGLSMMPASDPVIRKKLEQQMQIQGLQSLYQQLKTVDILLANSLHTNDTQRILRALEVYESTGIPLSEWQKNADKNKLKFDIRSYAVMPAERETLHHNIEMRLKKMLAQGFMDEMQRLYHRGDLSEDLPSMRCVGYRQAWQYLSGEGDFLLMQEKILAATRQLAKRQITWLRKWSDLIWFVPKFIIKSF